ncbi:HDIG domain-containing metalloprotein [Desulforamulus hydrothermalis]|uniref:HDIG domain-containing metalloprotein n=1 Tax=Desulforamulus hydrothermalis TaxID=412895 RepID=UPI000662BE42|nr:HDIG domain-containing metalloprotein [Desulforamulus hydrothermalis]
MLLNRLKQFWHALFSQVGPEETAFIKKYLDAREQSLFWAMDRPTQTHCIRVARTCLNLLKNCQTLEVNQNILLKSALLHDLGKPARLIKTRDRVLIVILSTLAPALYQYILQGKLGQGRFYRAAAAHANHCLAGARRAEQAGLPPAVIYLIANHHRPEQAGDPPELTLLRQADALN